MSKIFLDISNCLWTVKIYKFTTLMRYWIVPVIVSKIALAAAWWFSIIYKKKTIRKFIFNFNWEPCCVGKMKLAQVLFSELSLKTIFKNFKLVVELKIWIVNYLRKYLYFASYAVSPSHIPRPIIWASTMKIGLIPDVWRRAMDTKILKKNCWSFRYW